MFGMLIVAMLFFMVAGPLSLIITVPMLFCAVMAKGSGSGNGG